MYTIYNNQITNGADALPDIAGFFVHLEWDANTSRSELRFLICHPDGDMTGIPVHIGNWPVGEAVQRVFQVADEQSGGLVSMMNPDKKSLEEMIQLLITLTLYLCSAEPDVDTDRTPGWTPYKTAPVKTKTGLRLFPADKVHRHSVGESIGQRLREAADGESETIDYQGGTKRAHIRRGHWHGFWIGKRGSAEQEFVYHWIPPLVAGGKRGKENESWKTTSI